MVPLRLPSNECRRDGDQDRDLDSDGPDEAAVHVVETPIDGLEVTLESRHAAFQVCDALFQRWVCHGTCSRESGPWAMRSEPRGAERIQCRPSGVVGNWLRVDADRCGSPFPPSDLRCSRPEGRARRARRAMNGAALLGVLGAYLTTTSPDIDRPWTSHQ